MLSTLLLPNKYKNIGWCILIPATILGIMIITNTLGGVELKTRVFAILDTELFFQSQWFTFIEKDITPTIAGVLFIIGALLVGFSKEKNEDEFISNVRLSSLLWAVFVSYILLLLGFTFIYGTAFFGVMTYNMFTVLIIFIIRFNYILYRNSKSLSDEK